MKRTFTRFTRTQFGEGGVPELVAVVTRTLYDGFLSLTVCAAAFPDKT